MLTPRQLRFYVYRVKVWRKPATDLTKDTQSYELVGDLVPCKYGGNPDSATDSVLGRTRHDIFVTLDQFDFDLATDVRDGDYLNLVQGPAGFNLGQWWSVQGNVQTLGFHANVARVLAQQIPKMVTFETPHGYAPVYARSYP